MRSSHRLSVTLSCYLFLPLLLLFSQASATPFHWQGIAYSSAGTEQVFGPSPSSVCEDFRASYEAYRLDASHHTRGDTVVISNLTHPTSGSVVWFFCSINHINGETGWSEGGGWSSISRRGDGCPPGAAMLGLECAMPDPGVCEGGAHRGNPINVGSGNKFERASDYFGVEGLVFERFYNSRPHRYTDVWSMRLGMSESVEALLDHSGRLGAHWRHAFSRVLLKTGPKPLSQYEPETFTPIDDCQTCHGLGIPAADNVDLRAEVYLLRPDGRHRIFREQADGSWAGQDNAPGRLTEDLDAQGETVGWQYLNSNHETEIYNAQGRLLSIVFASGQTLQLTYDPVSERLLTVTDAGGRALTFYYDTDGRIDALHDPAGGVFEYTYDIQGNLIEVTYPDHTTRRYRYEAPQLPGALTAIEDETGAEYARFAYELFISGPSPEENIGRAVLSEHAGGAERIAIEYTAGGAIVTETIDANRNVLAVSDYGFEKHHSGYKPASIAGDACTDCGAIAHNEYDEAGRIILRTDPNGHQTEYDYNDRDLEIRRTEAFNTPQARTIITDWHPMYRLPIQITEPRKITEYVYDDIHGTANVLEKREIDISGACAPGSNPPPTPEQCERITVYHYYSPGHLNAHRLQQIDGPRTDVNDITTFEYDSEGNQTRISNALGHVTDITEHDAHGNPLTIIDPNGMITELEYDARQRLTQRTIAVGTAEAASTQFEYYPNGLLARITDPTGRDIQYHYDAAQRLTRIDDALGNTITYTLDNAGNRTQTDTRDPQGTLTQTQTAIYSSLNRLAEQLGAENQTTAFEYDSNGNPIDITDPKQRTTIQTYDSLNRLVEQLDPANGITRYDYNDADQLIRVEDPNTLETTYQYNGFDELIYQNSPDTRETYYRYDPAGNRIEQTDARGITVHYRYDASNRLIEIDYPDHPGSVDEDVHYTYDQTDSGTGNSSGQINYGIGRLTQIQDASGQTHYHYDRRGNRITADKIIHTDPGGTTTISLTIHYAYDSADRLIQTTYPSGRTTNYQHNAAGQINQVSTTHNSQTQILADPITYRPFGALQQATLGNGLMLNYHYDMDARLSQQTTVGIHEQTYAYDLNSNINQITRPLNTVENQTLDYDALDRLIQADSPAANHSYSYDPTGNRQSKTENGQTETYSYIQNTHRLEAISGAQNINYQYDAAGNSIQRNSDTFIYNQAGRLARIETANQTIEYLYNAQGQRTLKHITAGSDTQVTLYVYNLEGLLIAELNNTGETQVEYAYLNSQPLTQINAANAEIYYYHNDHLGTPQKLTNQNQTIVWEATYSPFGQATVNEDPDNDGNTVTQNIRFPGQYYDQETGLHYNWFRYYDPGSGRYITSDPIGLEGGLNTYTYVLNNPIRNIDPTGLICIWIQSTGSYSCYNPPSSEPYAEGTSYSGHGVCVNNPLCEHQRNWGPIPKGCYKVEGQPGDSRRNLMPMSGTNTHGRDAFQIHGDWANPSDHPEQSASKGCPIINKDDRNQIPNGEIFCVL